MKKNLIYFILPLLLSIPCFGQITLNEAFALYEGQSKERYEEFLEHKSNNMIQEDTLDEDYSMTLQFDPCELVNIAKKYVGTPYRYGGSNYRGFDCSGFMGYIFGRIGFSLPRSSNDISKIGRSIEISEVNIGDLMFFKSRIGHNNHHIGHVGLVVDKIGSEIHVIHASTSRGVVIEKFTTSEYLKKAYISSRRILPVN